MSREKTSPPLPVRILAILLFLFGLFAFWGSLFLWGEGFLLRFPAGVDYSFPITDILINAPASIIAAIGLWKLKRYGYIASQFVAGFYIYASVEIFVHVAQGGPPYALEIIVPQILAVLVAIGLVFYLWRVQDLFHLGQPVTSPSPDRTGLIARLGQLLKGGLTGRQVGGIIGLSMAVVIAALWFAFSAHKGDNRFAAFVRRLAPPTPTLTPTATRPPAPTPIPTSTPVPTATPRFFEPSILVGCTGIARGCFDTALSLDVDGKGNIYVGDDSDFIGGRVQVFDPTGEFIAQWLIGDKDTDLDRIAVDRHGLVYVVSDGNIYRFEGATGKPLGQIEYSGGQGFQDMAVTADGKLVASWNRDWQGGLFVNFNESQDDIVVFDSEGQVMKVLPKALSEIAGGEAELDTVITVDKQGNIYATGMLNPAIYKFAPDGKFLNKLAQGKIEHAIALAVDAQGRIYVSSRSDILIFAPDGRYIEMEDWGPNDMVFNEQNELIILRDSEVIRFVLNR